MRNSLCFSPVEYSYKINFWCFRVLFVPGRQSHFRFVNLLVMSKWVNLLLLFLFFWFLKERKKKDVLYGGHMWDVCARLYSDLFPLPVPFISKLHLDFLDYICLICHSVSTTCSDNAEHARVPLLRFYFPVNFFVFLRSEEFLWAFQDIWEHLKIIISKLCCNEGKGFC